MSRMNLSPPSDPVGVGPFVSIEEAAARYSVSTRTVRRWIADGTLPAHRVGSHLIRIAAADLASVSRPLPSARPKRLRASTLPGDAR